MASACSASFTVNVGTSTDCTVALEIPGDVTVNGNALPGGFIKDFTYTLGTDPDRNNPNYGFRLAFSGPAAAAVSASYVFIPTTPRIETPNQPSKVQNGRLLVNSIEINAARAAALDNPGTVSINLTIFVNTGHP